MRRDPEAIRQILIQIERSDYSDNPASSNWIVCEISGFSRFQIRHHFQLLLERKLLREESVAIDAADYNGNSATKYRPDALTDQGHELLESIRDPQIWRATKESAEKVGSFSFDLIKQIAVGLIKTKVKEHTGVEIDA